MDGDAGVGIPGGGWEEEVCEEGEGGGEGREADGEDVVL